MSPSHLTELKRLIDTAFEAVGSRMPVECDDGSLFVRDMIVEIDKDLFLCYEATSPDRSIFSFEVTAADSAAAAIAIHILKGIVARAVHISL